MATERRLAYLPRSPVKVVKTRIKRDDGSEGEGAVIEGYASVFFNADDPGTEYKLDDDFFERVLPTAFDDTLRDGDDVLGLYNHDINRVLGRRGAGTLRLAADRTGLRYSIDAPDTSYARDLVESIGRGDIPGSSFAFDVDAQDFSEEKGPDGRTRYVRSLRVVRLRDVSPVACPAYTGTSVGLRAAGPVEEARQALLSWRRRNAVPVELALAVARTRLRLGEAG